MSPADLRDWSLALMIAAVCFAIAIVALWLIADLAVDAVKGRMSPAEVEGSDHDA